MPLDLSKGKNHDNPKPVVARTPADIQRLKLEKLMKNPDKPIVIPEKPKERGAPVVPDFVRNVMGSSAGAGSGEFHVYRHLRRKEYARQHYMNEKARWEKMEDEYHQKIEDNKRKADGETAKKRAKRLKKKRNQRGKPKGKAKSSSSSSSETEESDKETENAADATSNEDVSKSAGNNSVVDTISHRHSDDKGNADISSTTDGSARQRIEQEDDDNEAVSSTCEQGCSERTDNSLQSTDSVNREVDNEQPSGSQNIKESCKPDTSTSKTLKEVCNPDSESTIDSLKNHENAHDDNREVDNNCSNSEEPSGSQTVDESCKPDTSTSQNLKEDCTPDLS